MSTCGFTLDPKKFEEYATQHSMLIDFIFLEDEAWDSLQCVTDYLVSSKENFSYDKMASDLKIDSSKMRFMIAYLDMFSLIQITNSPPWIMISAVRLMNLCKEDK